MDTDAYVNCKLSYTDVILIILSLTCEDVSGN